MKRIQTFFLIALMLFSINVKPAKAFLGFGDIVFDPAAFGQFIVSYGTQIGQFVSENLTQANTYLTQLNTYATMYNQTIFRPIQDALMIKSIIQSSNGIKSLILGSVGGQTSLLIQNPQFYLKQQGVNSLKISVNSVSQANGVYSNSILDSIIRKARVASDPAGALANCSKSSIPKTIQDSICTDDVKLQSLAADDVAKMQGNDPAAIKARATELWEKLCIGDPNTDPALADVLTQVGKQTGVGGWNSWLAMTGGDNEYKKTNDCVALAEQQQAALIEAKAADLQRGNGIISKTECLKKSTDLNGAEICEEESITQTGYQLSEAFKSAINAPLDVIKNAFGTGGTFSVVGPLLTNISQLMGNINMMKSSLNLVTGTLSPTGPGGDPRLQILIKGQTSPGSLTTIYSSSTLTSSSTTTIDPNIPMGSSTPTQDLAGNLDAKNALTKPILDLLTQHSASLITLKNTDNNSYLPAIAEYLRYIDGVGNIDGIGCYNKLITDFPVLVFPSFTTPMYYAGKTIPSVANDPRIKEALDYYNAKKTSIATLKTQIANELSLIGSTKSFIDNTISKIANSNSTEEISGYLDAYNTYIEVNQVPSAMSGATRESDVMKYKANTATDIRDFTGITGAESYSGKIAQLNNQCKAIRTEEQAKRDAAQQEYDYAKNFVPGQG